MTTSLQHLLERVKAATGPDRNTSAEIWLACGAMRKGNLWKLPGEEFVSWSSPPDVTTSIDAALSLVERKLPGHVIYSFGNGDLDRKYMDVRRHTSWRCGMAQENFQVKSSQDVLRMPCERGATPALAILACLLSALIDQANHEGPAA